MGFTLILCPVEHTMRMEKLLADAKKLQHELIGHRRYLHEHAETGFDMAKTTAYIKETLQQFGYTPKKCGKAGLVATVGKKSGKTILLRADIDGLPITEKTGLAYACKNGNMHACGHDLHATALLGAAKLLKAREKELPGRVKLLFQPAEELLEGAKDVIESGLLEDPKPNAAVMLHVLTGVPLPVGTTVVASGGVSAPAADFFHIHVQGKGCHGAAPWNGVDALTVASHILLALQEISARELPAATPVILTIGKMQSEGTDNAITDSAILKGTLRSFDEGARKMVKKRMEQISKHVARAFRAKAEITYNGGCPTLRNDETMSCLAEEGLKQAFGKDMVFSSNELGGDVRENSGGSEDFAYISHKVPSVMVALSAGQSDKGYPYPLHHPKTAFDEGVLWQGSAIYACIAISWLNNKG